MMKWILIFIFCLPGLLSFGQKSFVPASPYPYVAEQSDGTKLSLFGRGDESLHYSITEDGYTVIKNNQGIYEYAELGKNDKLVPSGLIARDLKDRGIGENPLFLGFSKNIKPVADFSDEILKTASVSKVFPATGTKRTLLILISYPDLDSIYTRSNFENLMNQGNYGGTGSMNDYYLECSDNKLDLSIDVFGWYTASHDYLYYGDKNGDDRARELVSEAIDAAEAAGVDFSLYDNDGNGTVENLMIVHSGPGAEQGSQTQYIWSHSWYLGDSYDRFYDGVDINAYIIQPETRSYGMVGIGVFCHEFGHALGLPDLYDIDESSEGLGNWCLMAGGSWLNQEKTPALMSGWCREKLGWISPTVIPWPMTPAYAGNYTLQPAATAPESYKILTPNANEYFLLENKFKTGFNSFLPGSGLAVFHVNTNRNDNTNEAFKLVDLEEADGRNDLDNTTNRGDTGDLFPGSFVNRAFNDYSNPSAQTYDPSFSGVNIENIELNGSLVSFSLAMPQIPGPNLTFDSIFNSVVISSTDVNINLQVENTGNEPSGAFSVGYYLSDALPVSASGILMGTGYINSLASESFVDISFSKDINMVPSLPLGDYYVGYVVDYENNINETDENDNLFSFTGQQVSHTSLPNLTYTSPSNLLVIDNSSITIGLEVKNDGNSTSGACRVGYYLSSDQVITPSDYLLGDDFIGILNSGQSVFENIVVDVPALLPLLQSGSYYIGYVIDYEKEVEEEDETDNIDYFIEVFNYCAENITVFNESICGGESFLFNGVYYTEQGEYEFGYTAANGCDSVVVLNLDVHQPDITELNEVICEGDFYQVGGNFYSETGSFNNVFENSDGCDSLVILNLEVRQPQVSNRYRYICEGNSVTVGSNTYTETGVYNVVFTDQFGCDSTIVMHLTVSPVHNLLIAETICEGEFYTLGNNYYSSAGIYSETFINQFGCDSVVTVELTVNDKKEVLLTENICFGDSIIVGGTIYKIPGVYEIALVSYFGCDSIVTLDLTVIPQQQVDLVETICEGESYSVGGINYVETGIYENTLISSLGCDSLVTLNLTVIPDNDTIIYQEICDGDSVLIDNSVYKTSGIYENTISSEGGCSYTVTLYLSVNPAYETNLNLDICQGDSVVVGGIAYKSSGVYETVFSSYSGCDSIVVLDLTVLPANEVYLSETICEGKSYNVAGVSYFVSGIYENTLSNQYGCDSLIVLDLTVIPASDEIIYEEICEGESVQVGNEYYYTSGVFETTLTNEGGCNYTVILYLQVNPVDEIVLDINICEGESVSVGNSIYNETGEYISNLTNQHGCDSIVFLNLQVKPVNHTFISETICFGESIIVGSSVYSESGIYTDYLSNQFGCDSIVTLDLKVNPTQDTTILIELCDGESYLIGDNSFNKSGTYSVNLTNRFGCDSIITLVLDVLPVSETFLDNTICQGDSVVVGSMIYKTSGSYINKFVNQFGCDSIVYLDLTVCPVFDIVISETICEGDSVIVGNRSYYSTGLYENIFSSQFGCDSIVTLDLKVNPAYDTTLFVELCQGGSYLLDGVRYRKPGTYFATLENQFGCDSVVTLNLNFIPVYYSNTVKNICEGDSVVVGNSIYKTSGVFKDVLDSQFGCDSVVTTRLTVNPNIETIISETICDGESFMIGAEAYSTPGTYYHYLTNQFGCDSVVVLTLTVKPSSTEFIYNTICQGDSVVVGGQVFKDEGIYETTIMNQFGCDSIVVLDLTVNLVRDTSVVVEICEGDEYTFGDEVLRVSGKYYLTLSTQAGCDSLVELNLNVNQSADTVITKSICMGESYNLGDSLYSQEGEYTHILSNHHGCDSTVTLILLVKQVDHVEVYESICNGDSIICNGAVIKEAGSYTTVFVNQFGCDSVVTLNLVVNPIYESVIYESICFGEAMEFGGSYYSSSGVYSHSFSNQFACDSLVRLHLIVNPISDTIINVEIEKGDSVAIGGEVYKITGNYTTTLINYQGCDSIITLNLLVKDDIPVSVTDELFISPTQMEIKLYPNPATHHVNVEIDNLLGKYVLRIVSIDGRAVLIKNGYSYKKHFVEQIELRGLSNGMYSVFVETGIGHCFDKLIVR